MIDHRFTVAEIIPANGKKTLNRYRFGPWPQKAKGLLCREIKRFSADAADNARLATTTLVFVIGRIASGTPSSCPVKPVR